MPSEGRPNAKPSRLAPLPRLGIQEIRRTLSFERCYSVLGGHHGHFPPRVHRSAGDVGREHYVFDLEQQGIDLRLALENIDARAGDHSLH